MSDAARHDSAEAYYRTRFTQDDRRAGLWRHLTAYIKRYMPQHGAILELGAGYCYFINQVEGRRRVAVDLGAQVVASAAPGVEAYEGDALTFLDRIEPGSFDFVFASNFFEHFEWPALTALIRGIHRALAPGGRLAIVQPNFRLAPRRYFDDYTHRTIFTDVSLADWLQSEGFTVIAREPRFMPFTVKSRLGGLTWLVPLYLRLPWRPFAGQMFIVAERPHQRFGGTGHRLQE